MGYELWSLWYSFFCRWLENAQLYLYDCVILGIGLNWIGFVGSKLPYQRRD